ncbi:hypothetical protein BO85DRAFT_434490 [Aspergillus piperis CBS 112811]|uniref:Uncharacterized protein n=1 Tax=Aspergillus piperis CBS 112811 TaxID=1448313 RepID=A0A8G1REI6_9EURO|nr:hypothetical protein BO85DRAFT_434490 [Aspergillus piperis CBS 112811]RAH61840.1 hypothetical protein BO85DRAFT_434490 [Aspergillus piperis CBS 112811]
MAREELGLAEIESPEEAHENVVLALTTSCRDCRPDTSCTCRSGCIHLPRMAESEICSTLVTWGTSNRDILPSSREFACGSVCGLEQYDAFCPSAQAIWIGHGHHRRLVGGGGLLEYPSLILDVLLMNGSKRPGSSQAPSPIVMRDPWQLTQEF